MGGVGKNDQQAEIGRMQHGLRAGILRTASGGVRGLRRIPPPALLSMLCASAFSPLISVSAGLTGAAATAGFTVLSSVSGGALSGVIANALDRAKANSLRQGPGSAELSVDVEQSLAGDIRQILEAGGAEAAVLRAEIAAVLKAINAGETMLRAAIETGDERLRSDLVAAVCVLSTGFAQMEFLLTDVARAAASIQRGLDEQGTTVRVVVEQNNRQATDIRLVREELEVIERRTRAGFAADAGSDLGPRWLHGCPYRGLLAFSESDADVFYGRERLTTELVVRVARGGLLVVTGASGAGKSSLLHAGLLPAVARGIQIEGSGHWPRIAFTPTAHPLTELAVRLASLTGGDALAVRDSLAQHPSQAHLAVWQAVLSDAAHRGYQRPASSHPPQLLLIVDQFEQVFTLNPGPGGESERQAFITALYTAATSPAGPDHQPPAMVAIAVRSDFWDRCVARPELNAALKEGQFVVGPMSESDLRVAITGPADAAGLQIDPALVDTIAGDLRSASTERSAGVLPLLSQAMLLTWENREGTRLTSRGYSLAGGVARAVQVSADDAYDAFTPGQQILARDLLRSMTVVSREGRLSRRPASRAALENGRTDADRVEMDIVLEAFAAQRLVVLSESTAEIAHDALLYAWPRLRGWLDGDRASWLFYSQLTEDAAGWQDHGNDTSFLYRGTQLATLQQAVNDWAADPGRYPAITATQRDFLRASARAATRSTRQRQVLTAALVVLLIASLTGAGIAAAAARNANSQRSIVEHQRNVAVSGQLAAASEEFDATDPATASQLAAAAWRISRTAQAEQGMLDVLAQPERGVVSIPAAMASVAFSPDGETLATGDFNGQARLWNVASHQQSGAPMQVATGSFPEVQGVVFSPDGKTLATASYHGTIRLWDVATHRHLGTPLDTGDVSAIAFSPDGRSLEAAGGDGMVHSWRVDSHRQLTAPFTAVPGGSFAAAAFSTDGRILAITHDGQILLWKLAARRQVGTLEAPGVVAVAFSPDGKTLAAGSGNGLIRLWDVTTRRSIGMPMKAGAQVVASDALAFSPDGKILATAAVNSDDDNKVSLWNVTTQQQTGTPITTAICDGGVFAVTFSPATNFLATAGCDGTAQLWDVTFRYQVGGSAVDPPLLALALRQQTIAFSPDGKELATGGQKPLLWDVASRHVLGAFHLIRLTARERRRDAIPDRGLIQVTGGVAFSPDGKLIAASSLEGWIRLCEVSTRRQIGAALYIGGSGPTAMNVVAAFSPDSKFLITVGGTGTVRLWHVDLSRRADTPLRAYVKLGNGVIGAAFSPNGKTVATADNNNKIQLWDVSTHRQIGAALDTGGLPVGPPVFSPNGKILAAKDGNGVRLWDVATLRQIGTALADESVDSLVFSPDGRILATHDEKDQIRFWDMATHNQIGSPLSLGSFSFLGQFMAFSPNGRILAVTHQNAVEFWDVAIPSDLLATACSIAGHSLTRQQWNTYAPAEPFQQVCPTHATLP